MRRRISRRTILRGAFGTAISLPLFEFMLNDNGNALADGTALPCRYFVAQCPTALVTSGSRDEAMTPARSGFDYDTRFVLEPLRDRGVNGDVSVISGLFAPPLEAPGGYNVDYHGQATFAIMTGLRSGFSGVTWRPQGVSADQIVASAIGLSTRFPYLYYQLDPEAGGTQVSYEQTRGFDDEPEIVYRGITPQVSPALAYASLFMDFVPPDTTPDPQAELERRLRVSSLSYAREQITSFQGRLGANDRRILEEHLSRVRALETRLADVSSVPTGAGCSDPMISSVDPPALATDLPDQDARAELFVELVQMAFACDMTRVLTLGGASVLTGAGMRHSMWNSIGGLHGEVQHASDQENLDAANRWFVDVYARVIAGLKATPEGPGTVLDRTAAVFVMEGGKGLSDDDQRSGDGGGDPNHSVDNAVMLLGGRSGGLRAGQHLNLSGMDLHPAVVMNTAMRAVGVDENLGEITGTLDALFEG
jgi:hypothetical protein